MNLRIRPIRIEDAGAIHAIRLQDAVLPQVLTLPSERPETFVERLQHTGERSHQLVAERDGKVIGWAGLERFPGRMGHAAELFIMLDGEHHGAGVGTALLEKLLELADLWLMLERVELYVLATNPRAQRLYERLGFTVEGREHGSVVSCGRYTDAILMARLRPGGLLVRDQRAPAVPEVGRAPTSEDGSPPEAIVVRPVTDLDAAAVHAIRLQESVLPFTLALPSQTLESFRAHLAQLGPSEHTFVAERAQRVVGYAGLKRFPGRLEHGADLFVMVDERQHGTGVGTALVGKLLELADQWLMLERVQLGVLVTNPRAQALYARLGFAVEGLRRGAVVSRGHYVDEVRMARLRPGGVLDVAARGASGALDGAE